jgi:hypothetical protein
MPGVAATKPYSPPAFAGRWLWAIGIVLVVFAARCREILLYAGDVPYLDQWWVEARQVLIPWLQGKLSWTDFFQSHHEHIPLWTRLMAWLEAALFGRWDPQFQCTINASFFGVVIAAGSDWLRRTVSLVPALTLTALAVALAALPHGWENSTWGFQSLVPFALLFGIWHVGGAFGSKTNSISWWLAQAAGLAVLFTFGSMWTAPAAVVLTALWTAAPGRLRWVPPALLAIIGVILFFVARAHQPHSGAFVLSASSPQQFLAAFLIQLGWPSQLPGAAALLYAPAFILALRLRRNAAAENADRVVVALALWSAAQAAAFAYGRGSYLGFVSRYGDLLAVGVIANAIATWRLLHQPRSRRFLLTVLGIAWLAVFIPGLKWVSTRAHTEFFHGHAPAWTETRRNAVRQYLTTKDPVSLSSEAVRSILYPDPAIVAAALDTPGLPDLLPVTVRTTQGRTRGDFASAIAYHLREHWPALVATGATLLLLGVALTVRSKRSSTPPSPIPTSNPVTLPLLGTLTVITGGLIFLWPMPLEFHPDKRWGQMLVPPGMVKDLGFRITTPTTYKVDNLTGGVALWPENFRNTFFGTHIDGPAFTGRAESTPFPIKSRWLVIPITGFPNTPGNGLRLKIESSESQMLTEIACDLPNPTDIDFWSVDVRPYQGQQARVVFYDGHNDAEGWVGAGSPQPAQDGNLATRLQRSWVLERTTSGHDSTAVLFLSLLMPTLFMGISAAFRSRKISNRPVPPTGS